MDMRSIERAFDYEGVELIKDLKSAIDFSSSDVQSVAVNFKNSGGGFIVGNQKYINIRDATLVVQMSILDVISGYEQKGIKDITCNDLRNSIIGTITRYVGLFYTCDEVVKGIIIDDDAAKFLNKWSKASSQISSIIAESPKEGGTYSFCQGSYTGVYYWNTAIGLLNVIRSAGINNITKAFFESGIYMRDGIVLNPKISW